MGKKYRGAKFNKWRQDSMKLVQESGGLPTFDEEQVEAFNTTLMAWFDCAQKIREADKKLFNGKTPRDEKDAAKQERDEGLEAIPQLMDDCLEAAIPLLDTIDEWKFPMEDDDNGEELAKAFLYSKAMFHWKALGQYCGPDDENAETLLELLEHNLPLLREFLYNGGPVQHLYGQAYETYKKLMDESTYNAKQSPLTYRLALACALELTEPIEEFRTGNFVDPCERYQYYVDAYNAGELDPAFATFNTFQLRFVVNANVTHDTLTWARETLKNYHPNFIYNIHPSRRYVNLVISSVRYRKATYLREPLTHPQILSEGGRCGARAWMGRLLLRAFGIPTWDVFEPGHSALIHWTSPGKDWTENLGFGLRFGVWNMRRAEDFNLEAKAREKLSLEEYGQKVSKLDILVDVMDEGAYRRKPELKEAFSGHPYSFYWSLGILQRYRIVKETNEVFVPDNGGDDFTPPETNVLKDMQERDDEEETEIVVQDDGTTIVVPAAAYNNGGDDGTNSKNVSKMKSYLGGQQVLLSQGGQMTYNLGGVEALQKGTEYALSCRVCTIHETDRLSLDVSILGEPVTLELPYTMGEWQVSEPVTISIPEEDDIISMTVSRGDDCLPIAIKEFLLSPIVAEE